MFAGGHLNRRLYYFYRASFRSKKLIYLWYKLFEWWKMIICIIYFQTSSLSLISCRKLRLLVDSQIESLNEIRSDHVLGFCFYIIICWFRTFVEFIKLLMLNLMLNLMIFRLTSSFRPFHQWTKSLIKLSDEALSVWQWYAATDTPDSIRLILTIATNHKPLPSKAISNRFSNSFWTTNVEHSLRTVRPSNAVGQSIQIVQIVPERWRGSRTLVDISRHSIVLVTISLVSLLYTFFIVTSYNLQPVQHFQFRSLSLFIFSLLSSQSNWLGQFRKLNLRQWNWPLDALMIDNCVFIERKTISIAK